MFMGIFRRKKKKNGFTVIKGSVLVPEKEMEEMRTVRVPVRCLDGTVTMTEKQIPVAVCRAIESVSYRLLAEHERFLDLSYQPRKKAGKVKVTALLGVLCYDNNENDNQSND